MSRKMAPYLDEIKEQQIYLSAYTEALARLVKAIDKRKTLLSMDEDLLSSKKSVLEAMGTSLEIQKILIRKTKLCSEDELGSSVDLDAYFAFQQYVHELQKSQASVKNMSVFHSKFSPHPPYIRKEGDKPAIPWFSESLPFKKYRG